MQRVDAGCGDSVDERLRRINARRKWTCHGGDFDASGHHGFGAQPFQVANLAQDQARKALCPTAYGQQQQLHVYSHQAGRHENDADDDAARSGNGVEGSQITANSILRLIEGCEFEFEVQR
jgi:hypothetical protein